MDPPTAALTSPAWGGRPQATASARFRGRATMVTVSAAERSPSTVSRRNIALQDRTVCRASSRADEAGMREGRGLDIEGPCFTARATLPHGTRSVTCLDPQTPEVTRGTDTCR
jgi:hypothetical protein